RPGGPSVRRAVEVGRGDCRVQGVCKPEEEVGGGRRPANGRHSGARRSREPGIHRAAELVDEWISGPRYSRPGMTARTFVKSSRGTTKLVPCDTPSYSS